MAKPGILSAIALLYNALMLAAPSSSEYWV